MEIIKGGNKIMLDTLKSLQKQYGNIVQRMTIIIHSRERQEGWWLCERWFWTDQVLGEDAIQWRAGTFRSGTYV